jgi:hypothetical protein
VQEITRQAIREYVEYHSHADLLDQVLDEELPRYAEALERLGKGRPRTRPGRAMADKAYSSAANRAYLRRRSIQAVIPVKVDQRKNRRAGGRFGGRAAGLRRWALHRTQTPSSAVLPSSSSSAP